LAKPNYEFEKRRRELEKKKKMDEKRQRKLEKAHGGDATTDPVPDAAAAAPTAVPGGPADDSSKS
jgi:hypothetical protein